MKCPCIDCICIPICKNRRFVILIDTCTDWKDFVGYSNDHLVLGTTKNHKKRFLEFRDALKPNRWYITGENKKYGYSLQAIPKGGNRNDPKYNPPL